MAFILQHPSRATADPVTGTCHFPLLCVRPSVVPWIQHVPPPPCIPHRSKALSSVVFWERLGGKQRLQIPKYDPWVRVYSAYIIVGHLRRSKILRWNLFSLSILKFHSFWRSLAFQFPSCSWEIQSSSFLANSLPFLQLPSIFQIRVVILFCSCHPSQEPCDLGLIPLFIPGTNKWESRVARPPCLVNVQGHLYASKYLNPRNPLCKYFDTITISNPRST